MTATVLPQSAAPARVGSIVVETLDALIDRCPFDPAAVESACARVVQLARRHLLRAFQSEGVFVAAGERHEFSRLQQQLHVIASYERLFRLLIEMLALEGVTLAPDGTITTAQLPDTSLPACAALRERILADHPDRAMLIPLVDACAPEAIAVVTGRKSAVEVLFPGGSSALVENVYARDAVSGFFNALTAGAVGAIVRSRRDGQPGGAVSVLEVGAGTGGTTTSVLQQLAPLTPPVTYYYTDISTALLQQAEETFGPAHPNATFAPLDIGADPVAQGFAAAANDVVIAANVLHATRDIATTLQHVKQLLRPGGVLVLNEVTRAFHFTGLTFGLTSGWWLFDDDGRISGAPLLSIDGWRRALTAAGFGDVRWFTPFTTEAGQPPQTLILAVNDAPASHPNVNPNTEVGSLIWQQLKIIDAQLDLLRVKGSGL
jgi:SAM-dependent methyltransferase